MNQKLKGEIKSKRKKTILPYKKPNILKYKKLRPHQSSNSQIMLCMQRAKLRSTLHFSSKCKRINRTLNFLTKNLILFLIRTITIFSLLNKNINSQIKMSNSIRIMLIVLIKTRKTNRTNLKKETQQSIKSLIVVVC